VLVQRLEGVPDLLFRQAAHLGDDAHEILQVGVEGLDRVFHHRHVEVLASVSRRPPRVGRARVSRSGR